MIKSFNQFINENVDSIHSKYQEYGVDDFYQNHFDQYKNPHEEIIDKAIDYVEKNWEINFNKTLDLACGTGEVTKELLKLGYTDIDACDAYSCEFYKKETNRECKKISFDDIIKGKLDNEKYDTIVCSFAMHLLEESKLPTFLYKLTQISNQLLILSPHKRPIVKEEWGWTLQNELTQDKVRIRLFKNNI
jgi:2-polyprenyl-3-methyl-5-hydroxy-6-metoxy-1,4-benzoquinol methylase